MKSRAKRYTPYRFQTASFVAVKEVRSMNRLTHYEQIPVRKVKEIMAIREMQGFQSQDRERVLTSLRCRICNEPVPVETAKTDDHGQAIHEVCYIKNLTR